MKLLPVNISLCVLSAVVFASCHFAYKSVPVSYKNQHIDFIGDYIKVADKKTSSMHAHPSRVTVFLDFIANDERYYPVFHPLSEGDAEEVRNQSKLPEIFKYGEDRTGGVILHGYEPSILNFNENRTKIREQLNKIFQGFDIEFTCRKVVIRQ
jgi:hypothetical protein